MVPSAGYDDRPIPTLQGQSQDGGNDYGSGPLGGDYEELKVDENFG